MALADSQKAIGAVTRLLHDHLIRRSFVVSIGKPEQALANDTAAKLNLFLYEISIDPYLRNVALDDDRPAPLWFTVKYLLTAFDDDEQSDTAAAHELLGQGMSALHELNFLRPDSSVLPAVRRALENNPEPFKITFDEASPELLSKVMQGTDEKYRLSTAFQVRPVMLIPNEPPRYTLLVGVDYSQDPVALIGEEGVELDIIASLGPKIDHIEPEVFEPGQTIEVFGEDLHLSELQCLLGNQVLSVKGQQSDKLTVVVEGYYPTDITEGPLVAGTSLSAGEHPLLLRQRLKSGRFRSSPIVIAALCPVVSSAQLLAGGELSISGVLLGTEDDDILVALLQDGRVAHLFDNAVPDANQKSMLIATVSVQANPGIYQVIVRVNSQQARISPTISVPGS